MKGFFQNYPYLWASLLSLFVFVTLSVLLLRKDHRNTVIFSGLVNSTAFVFLIHLEGVYWSPVRLGHRLLGMEDVICSFIVAAMAWFAVALVLGNRIVYTFRAEVWMKRFISLAGASVALFLLLCQIGWSGMTALVVTCLSVGSTTLWWRRDLWPLALAGTLIFPLLYLLMVKIDFWIWPRFVEQWNAVGPWGRGYWGIPLGEIAWSVVFGLYWPLFTGHIFDISLKRQPSQPASAVGIGRHIRSALTPPARRPSRSSSA